MDDILLIFFYLTHVNNIGFRNLLQGVFVWDRLLEPLMF